VPSGKASGIPPSVPQQGPGGKALSPVNSYSPAPSKSPSTDPATKDTEPDSTFNITGLDTTEAEKTISETMRERADKVYQNMYDYVQNSKKLQTDITEQWNFLKSELSDLGLDPDKDDSLMIKPEDKFSWLKGKKDQMLGEIAIIKQQLKSINNAYKVQESRDGRTWRWYSQTLSDKEIDALAAKWEKQIMGQIRFYGKKEGPINKYDANYSFAAQFETFEAEAAGIAESISNFWFNGLGQYSKSYMWLIF
jgi:hypothetical protein